MHSTVVTPSASISCEEAARARSSSSASVAARVCRTVRGDAAARRGDLEIAPAQDPLLELVGAPAGEGEMGVAVDQAGNHQPPAGIEPLGTRDTPPAARARGPTQRIASPIPGQRGVGDDVDVALPALGATGGELADVRRRSFMSRWSSSEPSQRSPDAPASRSSSVDHRQVDPPLLRRLDGELVPGVGVAHDAGARDRR